MNLERLALDAVAGNDEDIGLDTLRATHDDLMVLYSALTHPDGYPSTSVVANVVARIAHRIDLALALAGDDVGEKPEAAK
ncbi:MAG TPA: hypothetical protein VHB79_10420 [Polyangiaceae bacterium]|nr:hypothetical protein [Polyangiaceae bacterium]